MIHTHKTRYDAKRWAAKPWRKWYDRKAWKTIRAARLGMQPLCVMCSTDAAPVPANICDHIKPHRGDYALFFDLENTQSLCKSCHDGKKQRLETTGEIGCDANGMPLDPGHEWS